MKATALPMLCLICTVMEVHSQSITIVPGATDSTSVTISWALEGVTTTVMGYSISYSNTNTDCFTDSGTVFVSAGVITHTLTDLEESSEYTITVAAQLTGQGPVVDSITATTLLAAPSGPPTSVTTSQVTPFSITVVWGPLDCIHRNGDITCYLVRYSIQGSGSTPSTLQVCAAMRVPISGLSPATPYDIEVAAVNSAGAGVYYNINVLTLLEAPVVSLDKSTATNISLSWTSAGLVVERYVVMWERDTTGECSDEDEGNVTLSMGSLSYIITELEEDSSYTITVTAFNAAGSAVRNPVIGMTGKAAPSAPPNSVNTSQVTPISITMEWGQVDCIHRNGDITCYLVRYSIQGSGSAPSTLQVCAAMNITISGLSPATLYDIEVAAVNSAGTGVYYNISVPTLLKAPVVSVDSSTATNIFLSWTSAGMVVETYVVMWERDTSEECSDEDESSVNVMMGSLNYTITELEEDSSYTITVTAFNANGSVVGNPVIGMTEKAAPSAPPNSVNTSDVTSSSITVQWGAVDCIHRNGDILYYSVRYGVNGSAEGDRIVKSSIERMYEILGLTSSTTYCIEVAAVNSAGIGIYNDPPLCVTSLMEDSSEFPGTIAIFVGGGIAVVLIIAVMIIVVVALCRLHCCLCSGTPKREPRRSEDVLTNTNEAYELASVEENVYEEVQ